MVTGIDIVRCADPGRAGARAARAADRRCREQDEIPLHGYAIQCRVTTEDPREQLRRPTTARFTPTARRPASASASTAASAYGGAVITPVLRLAAGEDDGLGPRRSPHACQRMDRALREFRIRGVKTNIPFLENVVNHPAFQAGRGDHARSSTTRPSCSSSRRAATARRKLLTLPRRRHRQRQSRGRRASRCRERCRRAPVPRVRSRRDAAAGHAAAARRAGPGEVRRLDARAEAAAAHRHDLARRAPVAAGDARAHVRHAGDRRTSSRTACPSLFSLEMWGGATFDSSMRFLYEDPWERLRQLRERIPNICFQMLLRASNAVGYTTYPDNVGARVRRRSRRARASTSSASSTRSTACRTCGSPWRPCGRPDARLRGGRSATPATSSIRRATSTRSKYYVEMAKELEKMGAHILGIKDMAGLCRPYAA